MKSHKKKFLKIIFVLLVIILAMNFVVPSGYSPLFRLGLLILAHQVEQSQIRLLCKTNHQELLEACRELSKKVAEGDIEPGGYSVQRSRSFPEVSRFPKEILDIKPRWVTIDRDGRVVLQMGGGFTNFGLIAYPEDYKEPYPNFIYGDIKIIDGLWFHDAEYKGNPKYQQKIQELLQRVN